MQDSDYEHPDEHSDSEMYVLPAEETGDDSYEPPPGEQETRTVPPALPFARGEYIGEAAPQALGTQPARPGNGDKQPGRTVGASHSHHPTLVAQKPWRPKWKTCLFKGGKVLFLNRQCRKQVKDKRNPP